MIVLNDQGGDSGWSTQRDSSPEQALKRGGVGYKMEQAPTLKAQLTTEVVIYKRKKQDDKDLPTSNMQLHPVHRV